MGSVPESKEPGAWPQYEANYLARALDNAERKYGYDKEFAQPDGTMDETKRQVYLNKITANYKLEAEQALKAEFVAWLEGRHPVNAQQGLGNVYNNGDGKPVRRWTGTDEDGKGEAGQRREGWKHTNWGKAQLTHLPGVRQFLRDEYEQGIKDEISMNLLADNGPQDLESAWQYFKHWVKGRPLSDAMGLIEPRSNTDISNKSLIGSTMPHNMMLNSNDQRYNALPDDVGMHFTRRGLPEERRAIVQERRGRETIGPEAERRQLNDAKRQADVLHAAGAPQSEVERADRRVDHLQSLTGTQELQEAEIAARQASAIADMNASTDPEANQEEVADAAERAAVNVRLFRERMRESQVEAEKEGLPAGYPPTY